jgi:hypothetical protein
MVDLTINEEMKEILSSMKGKTLKSIEGNYWFLCKEFSEIVRLNLGQYAVELYVDYVAVKWMWGADGPVDDEENCFVIQKFDLNERNYPEGWKITQFLKDEKISEVVLVRDTIKTNRGDEIVSDSGIVIRTNEKVYSISRTWIKICLNESDRIDMPLSVDDVTEQYTDDYCGVKPVEVRRDFLSI